MEEQRIASHHSFNEMNRKLEGQSVGSTEWKGKIGIQLHSTHEKVEKFIGKELRKDVPTGGFNYLIFIYIKVVY